MSNNLNSFNIPVVLFFFKRYEKTLLIIDQLRKINPDKIYLISDGPRNLLEAKEINECRQSILSAIDWPCEIIKNFSDNNEGVFNRIGLGARWVFENESKAIFLEDDNLPELSFFKFCKEMLEYYENNESIAWVCGTNYLVDSTDDIGESYFFTQHMQPCGWASWAKKFNKYYDGYLDKLSIEVTEKLKNRYDDPVLYKQDFQNWYMEKRRIEKKLKPNSWDYQMSFSLRYYNLLGVVPKLNQIKNIGVDEHSIHGGFSLDNIMLQRFCYLETKEIEFPLIHPTQVLVNPILEKKLGSVIKFPLRYRAKGFINKFIKFILKIDIDTPIKKALLQKWKN